MNASLTEMLTPGEVASWLHTRTNFVLRLVRRGEIPHVKLPNGDVLFDRAELTDWVKTYRVGKAGQAEEPATADTRSPIAETASPTTGDLLGKA